MYRHIIHLVRCHACQRLVLEERSLVTEDGPRCFGCEINRDISTHQQRALVHARTRDLVGSLALAAAGLTWLAVALTI